MKKPSKKLLLKFNQFINEGTDEEIFKEEYTTVSLEEQFERGKITAKQYDKAVKLRDKKEKIYE